MAGAQIWIWVFSDFLGTKFWATDLGHRTALNQIGLHCIVIKGNNDRHKIRRHLDRSVENVKQPASLWGLAWGKWNRLWWELFFILNSDSSPSSEAYLREFCSPDFVRCTWWTLPAWELRVFSWQSFDNRDSPSSWARQGTERRSEHWSTQTVCTCKQGDWVDRQDYKDFNVTSTSRRSQVSCEKKWYAIKSQMGGSPHYQHCLVEPGEQGWWWKPYAKKLPRLFLAAKWTITL